MDDMNAFERQVAGESDWLMGPEQSFDVAEIVRETTSQAPRWHFGSPFGAMRFVVAGAIVVLFGGLLLAGLLTTRSDESDSVVGTSPSPDAVRTPPLELPLEIPEGVESGTLETPLGIARWVHLSGQFGTLPGTLEPLRAPEGFVSLHGHSLAFPDGPSKIWRSPDLITWTPESGPVPNGMWDLSIVDGEFWLVVSSDGPGRASIWRSPDASDWQPVEWGGQATQIRLVVADEAKWIVGSGPAGLWRSTDGENWTEIDMSELVAPGPSQATWALDLGTPTSAEGIGVIPTSYRMKQLGDLLGLGSDIEFLEPSATEDGVYTASVWDGSETTFRLLEADDDLLVIDEASGEQLARLAGVGIEFADTLTTFGEARDERFALIDGNSLRPLELPSRLKDTSTVFATPAGWRAYGSDTDGGPVRSWASVDGIEWTETGPVSLGSGGPLGIHDLRVDSESLHPMLIATADNGDWQSLDGTTWVLRPDVPGGLRTDLADAYDAGTWQLAETYFERADGGGLMQPGIAEQAIETLYQLAGDVTSPEDGQYSSAVTAVSLNTLALGVMEVDNEGRIPRQDIWIVTFDDLPTSSPQGRSSATTIETQEDIVKNRRTPIATALAIGLLALPGSAVAQEATPPIEVTGTGPALAEGCDTTDYVGPYEDIGADAQRFICSTEAGMPWSFSDPRLDGVVTRVNEESHLTLADGSDIWIASTAYRIENDVGSWHERPRTWLLPDGLKSYDWLPEQVYVLDGNGGYEGLVTVLRSAVGETDYRGVVMDARLFPPAPETAPTE